jgi:hypothetical protein
MTELQLVQGVMCQSSQNLARIRRLQSIFCSGMIEVIDYLRDMGLRDRFKVIVGGAETSQENADAMGADGWAPNAVAAVRLCRDLLGQASANQSAAEPAR